MTEMLDICYLRDRRDSYGATGQAKPSLAAHPVSLVQTQPAL